MLAKTPPMGFNTWNTFGENISDQLIRETADAMVENGLLDAGYEYLVIDDCWAERDRDPVTDKMVPHKVKFPNGMKAVSDYVHSKGLKFGIYSCAGIRTCANYPGSFGREFLDAETFAEWGCDFLKYDFCNRPDMILEKGYFLYRKMGAALRACGREILFSACNWGVEGVHEWIRSTGAHMFRSTGDIVDHFESFRDIVLAQLPKLGTSAPGCFNDLDMMTVGMYGEGNCGSSGGNDLDYKLQFVLWCMMSSPLMIGCDVRKMTDETKALLLNKDLIAINQDEEARPPYVASNRRSGAAFTLVKNLSDNELAIAFINMCDDETRVPLCLNDIGLTTESGYGLRMKNLFTGEVHDEKRDYMEHILKGHDCTVYRCSYIKK